MTNRAHVFRGQTIEVRKGIICINGIIPGTYEYTRVPGTWLVYMYVCTIYMYVRVDHSCSCRGVVKCIVRPRDVSCLSR